MGTALKGRSHGCSDHCRTRAKLMHPRQPPSVLALVRIDGTASAPIPKREERQSRRYPECVANDPDRTRCLHFPIGRRRQPAPSGRAARDRSVAAGEQSSGLVMKPQYEGGQHAERACLRALALSRAYRGGYRPPAPSRYFRNERSRARFSFAGACFNVISPFPYHYRSMITHAYRHRPWQHQSSRH